jgi:hypothetical protein
MTTPNDTTRRPRRRILRDWRFWSASAIALYTLIGFVVVPLFAKNQIPKQVRKQLQCEATVKSVRFNPYTFNARVRGFALADRKGEPLAAVDELFVNFAPWPLTKKEIVLEEVRATGPNLAVRIRDDGTMNLLDLVPVAGTPADTTAEKKPASMVLRVDRATITNGTITYDDATTEPDASAALDSLNVTALAYRSSAGDTTQFQVAFDQRAGGTASAKGWVMPLEGTVHVRVDADSLNILPADPYLARFAYLDLKSGRIAVHADMHVVATPGAAPAIDFAGDIVSDDLRIYDDLKDQDFFGYRRLSVLKAEATSNPPSANVNEITLDGIYARIAIAADQSFNVTDVFAPAMARADSLKKAKAAASASDSTGTVVVSVPSAATEKAPPPDIAIGRIKIDGGEVDFSDLSLPLPFATRVHHVSGEITAIAPDNAAGSSLLVEGTVDEHGFAKASGFINLFDPVAFTDIDVDFRNIELTGMTPYSGKFMGYRIKRGKLSLGLEYDIKQAQLKGGNEILLEKLTLGDKIESPDAVGLPIKLAIALLKDKNGNIDLDLEVAGDLNDPKVNTASLIWQALKKVIIKITTAPFRFLGNLLGIGGDEMEFVEFEAGDVRLTPPQYERLGSLAKALTERPQLKLQVRGAYDKSTDAGALRAKQFEAILMDRLLASANGDSAAARAIVSDPSGGRMQLVLETLTVESFGAQAVPDMKAEHTKVPAEGGAARLDLATYFQAMRERLVGAQQVEEPQLVELSTRRAGAIRGYMIEMAKIPPERIELVESEVSDGDGDWVKCRLSLDGSD